jgi:ABC-2 type transport system ATP-binding protein
MIEVENLSKQFASITAVDRISFQVDHGEIVGFLGPNGAGKTTTMRMLTCYLPASAGRARVAGYDCLTQSLDVRRRIGYLPENVPIYPEMRVGEFLRYRAKLKGIPRRYRARRIDYCMERCRIGDVQRQLVGTLSKGYRQRVGLADAMLHDPDILILDEPTVGLDPIQIRETRALIKELGEQHTILLSTHILPEVEIVCRRVIIIADGRIVLEDQLDNLRREAVITLEVRGPEDQVRRALEATERVEHVRSLPPADGIVPFEVRTRDGEDLRETLFRRVADHGWSLRQLDLKQITLEDRFIQATMQTATEA